MDIQGSALDSMNSLATDIHECPKCQGEDLKYKGHRFDTETQGGVDYTECSECGHSFEINQ